MSFQDQKLWENIKKRGMNQSRAQGSKKIDTSVKVCQKEERSVSEYYKWHKGLTHSSQCCISYRNQSFDLQFKSNERFLYEMQNVIEMG